MCNGEEKEEEEEEKKGEKSLSRTELRNIVKLGVFLSFFFFSLSSSARKYENYLDALVKHGVVFGIRFCSS